MLASGSSVGSAAARHPDPSKHDHYRVRRQYGAALDGLWSIAITQSRPSDRGAVLLLLLELTTIRGKSGEKCVFSIYENPMTPLRRSR